MKALFKNANVYANGEFKKQTMLLDGASLSIFMGDVSRVVDIPVFDNIAIFPGFCDVHVHFREPGFSYKETIATGSAAAAHGGYTAVCTMPNLNPTPDNPENLKIQTDIIKRDAKIAVFPYGTITKGQMGEELSDMDSMKDDVIGFSDDGKGVQTDELMLKAMKKAHSLGKMIVAHCEDNSLLRGGYIHDGEYAKAHGHRGICSESEFGQIARDLELVKKVGCKYHVCHVSAKESVEVIRKAKANGIDVTCETAPHYLTMTDLDLMEHGRFKMNPPIRSKEDRDALIEGIKDGTVDMIATDHAPHSAEEKSKGLEKSNMGVVGIETSFAVMYTYLVKPGIISLGELVELMSIKPRKRFEIESDVGFTVFDLGEEYKINPDEFLSMGKSTPFDGAQVFGKCLVTVYNGSIAYASEKLTGTVNKSEDK
jgi:dihydroorotase